MKRRRTLIWTIAIAAVAGLVFAITSPTRADLNENEFNSGNGETWNDPNSPSGYYEASWNDWWDIRDEVTIKTDIAERTIDDSFGQGTKEDSPGVTVTLGSIPPNKSDLTNFYVASERRMTSMSGQPTYEHTFLYLAWTRTNALGSANMDFELNQVAPDLSSAGPTTLPRTPGDFLITYDFEKGGKVPAIAALSWVTTGSASRCYAGNRLPCWGDRQELLTSEGLQESMLAEGGIARGGFYDNVQTGFPETSTDGVYRPAMTFGEMAIDLSLVMPNAFGNDPKKCSGISSVFLKSRSSSSFTAEVKDFIAPHVVSFSNCGAVKVLKQGKDKRAVGGVVPLAGAEFRLTHTTSGTVIDTKTTAADGTICFDNILLNTDRNFTVTELSAPSGYADSAAQSVDVVLGTSCEGTGEKAPALLTFVDDPLTTISVSTASLAGTGVTESTVQCVKDSTSGTDTGETTTASPPHTTIPLKPGAYICTIVIDP